jgi:hypothetical protein
MNVTIKELVKSYTRKEFDISGGSGTSADEAVKIHSLHQFDYVDIETVILRCILLSQWILKFSIVKQATVGVDGKIIDEIIVEFIKDAEKFNLTYFFDVTDCFDSPERPIKITFNPQETLKKIENRLLQLEKLNDFNHQSIKAIRGGLLFEPENDELRSKFLDVIFKDESYLLFTEIWKYCGIPILKVLIMMEQRLSEADSQ